MNKTNPFIPITLAVLGLGPFVALAWWIFASQRDDVATARAFLTHIAEDDHAAARALMSPPLAVQMSTTRLSREFGQIEMWESLSFPNRSSNTTNGTRETEIYGTGTAMSGCESDLMIRLIDGLVDAFNVTPLCPRSGVDA